MGLPLATLTFACTINAGERSIIGDPDIEIPMHPVLLRAGPDRLEPFKVGGMEDRSTSLNSLASTRAFSLPPVGESLIRRV